MDLNSREIALLIWLGIGAVWAVPQRTIRQAFTALVRSIFAPILLAVFALAGVGVALGVWLLHRVGYWDITLLKPTILWFFGSAGLAAILTRNRSGYLAFWGILRDTLAFTALLEFILNLYTFPLIVELITLPLLFIIVGTKTVSEVMPEFADRRFDAVRTLLSTLLAAYGVVILSLSVRSIAFHFDEVATAAKIRELLLPAILTAWFIPFIYCARLYAVLEMALLRVRWQFQTDTDLYKFARLRIILCCGLNLWKACFFDDHFSTRFFDVAERQAVSEHIAAFHRAWRTRGHTPPSAGVDSVD
jgi:hypothetical protein